MSIGEAEVARFYWKSGWVDKKGLSPAAPKWLYRPNEGGWEGNWRVKFWDPDRQRLIIDDQCSFLNRIIDAGFDGVFLDVVEGGEYWADSERGADQRASAEGDMIAFVRRISHHARVVRGKTEFLVVPNGDFFLGDAAYRAAISAVLREDILYIQEGLQPPRVSPRPTEGSDGVDRPPLSGPDALLVHGASFC